jgi:hypothetical protein
MLHEATRDGGVGFCHLALPEILPEGYHGPLVVALDSTVLIDLQKYGAAMLDETIDPTTEPSYLEELEALGGILNLWMFRDIRFIVTPRSLTDAKRSTERFERERSRAVEALAQALAFQQGDWTTEPPSDRTIQGVGVESGLPDGPDRDLVLEAQAVGAHVFLTRDKRILRRTRLTGPRMAIFAPSDLLDELVIVGGTLLGGGTCGRLGCPYTGDQVFPDIGRHGALLGMFEDLD